MHYTVAFGRLYYSQDNKEIMSCQRLFSLYGNFVAYMLKLKNKSLTEIIYQERKFVCLLGTNHVK
jgi:hypothetical protein